MPRRPSGTQDGRGYRRDIRPDAFGKNVTLHEARAGHPAVVVFYRSALW